MITEITKRIFCNTYSVRNPSIIRVMLTSMGYDLWYGIIPLAAKLTLVHQLTQSLSRGAMSFCHEMSHFVPVKSTS